MAKRFRDTGSWKKKWIRELNPEMKLFWFYLLDNCDHAGIWEVDIELASFQMDVELDEASILEAFNRKIIPFKTDKWFVPKFIVYQYGELNENNRVHNSVINILNKYGLYKGRVSPLQGVKDKDKDKDKVKDKDKKSKKVQLKEIEDSLETYQTDFKNRNVKKEFLKFKDYLKMHGKNYKNYKAAFRNWLRNEQFQSATEEIEIKEDIIITCPNGHYKRKSQKGIVGVCPECRAQLIPQYEASA